ncbi:MAG TPA: hypothetical protein VGK90_04585 [Rhizomicrobium sp.]|jgi:hypothetical protein
MPRLLIISALALAAGNAFAGDYVYHYKGRAYQSAESPYTTSMRLKADVTLAHQIPPDYAGTVKIKSYRLFDGYYTANKRDAIQSPYLYVETDDSGVITGWDMQVLSTNPNGTMAGMGSENDTQAVTDDTCWWGRTQCFTMADNTNLPGHWSAGQPVKVARVR